MVRRLVAGVLAATLWAGTALAGPTEDLKALLDEHYAWALRNNPVYATSLGVRDYDAKLPDISLETRDRHDREAAAFLKRAEAIPPAALTDADRLNRDIFIRMLKGEVEQGGFGQRAMYFSNRNGWHTGAADWGDELPFYTKRDYENYIARMRAYPALNAQGIAVTRTALKGGFVQPCVAMGGFDKTITAQVVADPEKSPFWQPFAGARPATITESEWTALKASGRAVIEKEVIPAYRTFGEFYAKEYAPNCQKSPGVSALPNGPAWYAFLVREYTTTAMTPDEIHNLGQSEVARIRAEMEQVAAKAGFPGDRKGFIAKLRSDPQYYAKTPEELLAYSGALAKRIDGEMPKLFGRLPRLPYTVKPIPAATAEGTTTAYYEQGSLETGRAGVYRVNTSKLDQRPLFEMPALGVHEAVPGHHHQIALQQELDLPPFRRHFAFFTAFTEGWGLYSERLGIEMGLYDTPERDMGRLSYEMWRACRLVVDTGIHAKGWTKQQAIDFMTENTALSAGNIEAEVNRYIANPGQALAYKIGELKIRQLRTDAEKRLGARFDLRAFHDAVLENGSVPLDVLEPHMRRWIEAEAKKTASAAN